MSVCIHVYVHTRVCTHINSIQKGQRGLSRLPMYVCGSIIWTFSIPNASFSCLCSKRKNNSGPSYKTPLENILGALRAVSMYPNLNKSWLQLIMAGQRHSSPRKTNKQGGTKDRSKQGYDSLSRGIVLKTYTYAWSSLLQIKDVGGKQSLQVLLCCVTAQAWSAGPHKLSFMKLFWFALLAWT